MYDGSMVFESAIPNLELRNAYIAEPTMWRFHTLAAVGIEQTMIDTVASMNLVVWMSTCLAGTNVRAAYPHNAMIMA